MLAVRQIEISKDIEVFLRLPWSLYANDPNWVPPLLAELRKRFNPLKNPYFQHAQAALFLAERDGIPVGRITAQVCQLAQKHQRAGDGHFGFFECEASQTTSDALFDAAGSWLSEKKMTRMVGPFNFSIYDEAGLLVDGFHRPPFILMGHNLPYYNPLFLGSGLAKEIDVFAYLLDLRLPYPKRIQRVLQATSQNTNIHLRAVNKHRIEVDLGKLLEIFNESWADNWGHVPMTDAEVGELANMVKHLFYTDSVMLAEIDGDVVGFIVAIPNLNEMTRDLDGKLFPFGWLRLLYRIKFLKCRTIRVPLMGVSKKHQSTRTGASIVFAMIDRCRQANVAKGVTHCEMSWILESNLSMRGILDASESKLDKTYRIYTKTLSAAHELHHAGLANSTD